MNMDAIAILNDLVGGVKVNVTDDFSEIDPSITKGEMVLKGQQALTYVRTRQGLGDQLNVTRMQRQRDYMVGFMKALKQNISDSATFALEAYEKASPYSVTDCSSSAITALANRLVGYELRDVVAIQGENVVGEKYMEYHVDKDELDRIILKYLYAPKK
jgi:anionic cell wall polymer biosynthesis LytR-Cps2A-Psr (LCP) family protein